MWRASKKRNKAQSATARHHLTAYLEEFWWRNSIEDKNPLEELLKAVAKLYEPKPTENMSSKRMSLLAKFQPPVKERWKKAEAMKQMRKLKSEAAHKAKADKRRKHAEDQHKKMQEEYEKADAKRKKQEAEIAEAEKKRLRDEKFFEELFATRPITLVSIQKKSESMAAWNKKKLKKGAYKSLPKLKRKESLVRIKEIASLIGGREENSINSSDLQVIAEKVGMELGLQRQEKKKASRPKTSRSNKKDVLTPLQDLQVCSGSMTWYQRCKLKSSLIKCGRDVFAANNKVYAMLKQFSTEVSIVQHDGVSYVSNVKEVLQLRLSRLQNSGKLCFDRNFKNKFFLCFSGDKGGLSTKCCISIGNVKESNSVNNLLLVGSYDGDDKRTDLRNAFSSNIFEQVNAIKQLECRSEDGFVTKQVEWFATGNIKFLCALYGHKCASSSFPCLLCEAPATGYKEVKSFAPRTLESLKEAAEQYQLNDSLRNLRPQDKTALSKIFKSVVLPPALNIPICNVIPSSLHVIQGLAQGLINMLEKEAEILSTANLNRKIDLENVYRRLGADKRQYYQMFTDNHIRKLLTNDGPEKIVAVIKTLLSQGLFFSCLNLLNKFKVSPSHHFFQPKM